MSGGIALGIGNIEPEVLSSKVSLRISRLPFTSCPRRRRRRNSRRYHR
jgi:hypothetical protein